jgi:long-subunit acyl-CoA synthetase (AMP-forming)/ribosomal protein S18 acetylase RimI-like enzyme
VERSDAALLERADPTHDAFAGRLDMLPEADVEVPPEPAAALALVLAAERALDTGSATTETWDRYLDRSRRREFLLSLPDAAARTRWAETTFGAIRASGYSLARLLAQRVACHPDRVFLQGSPRPDAPRWTYAQIARRLRWVAAALASCSDGPPRVAISAENSLDAACCDLACLVHGIFVAPLAPHLSDADLTPILKRLAVNLVVVDTADQLAKIEAVAARLSDSVRPVLLDAAAQLKRGTAAVLGEEIAKLGSEETDRTLRTLAPAGLDETATVLFTSGSTGAQKGFAFSPFNLLTKRFARAAALPFVGEGEVLLCYLPLYHTFGRYLELMGTLFWGGTYVFAGNPSLETLLSGLRQVRPTGLVSIPARWHQLHERCQKRLGAVAGPEEEVAAVREITGGRLSWGLSAAGFLEPTVFRFFQRCGVAFCSGFGMTEATGGVTMTPPGVYEDGTVGLPLPGMRVRLAEDGELFISGPYVARDIEEAKQTPAEEHWIGSGDVFRIRPSGFFEIVDRVKDIYKNSRGQTVAPRRVEQLFEGVPGIRRTFLAGDGRDDNVLLIVPDLEAPLLTELSFEEERQDYFKRIVAEANLDLAPHERVVGFAVLDRDFTLERGELTPKGSYRRKAVEESFRDVLASLYRGTAVHLEGKDLRVRVPRWLHRDVGILEGDLVLGEEALEDRRRGLTLTLRRTDGDGMVRVGDLEYTLHGDLLDLGLLAHQPLLWLGNPSLAAFCPLKDGWDLPLGTFSPRVRLPAYGRPPSGVAIPARISSPSLAALHETVFAALFGGREESLRAVADLEERLGRADIMTAVALRRRLEALARHPSAEVRCAAFRILLLDEPAPGAASEMESFLESGLPFLSAESVETIARAGLPGERLAALRRRLHGYRARLPRPLPPAQADLLSDVLTLLVRHLRRHREDYVAVRSELACWALDEADALLSRAASTLLDELSEWYQAGLPSRASFTGTLAFHEGLAPGERERIEQLFDATGFLEESLELACGETVTPGELGEAGIWIAPVARVRQHQLYRAGINTQSGRHHDLLLIVGDDLSRRAVQQTTLWMEALASPAEREPVVPAFGCFRPELGALSVGWVDEPTLAMRLWELEKPAPEGAGSVRWRTLFVRALAAFFSAWVASGRRLVPGAVSPANVVVPRDDFCEGTVLLSLAGHRPYEGPWSLVGPMVKNFFEETLALYPRSKPTLRRSWISDACVEALGLEGARTFLDDLLSTRGGESPDIAAGALAEELAAERKRLASAFHSPLALHSAIERFEAWESIEPDAPLSAREAMARGLARVYRLGRFPEIVRYHLHRQTTFARSNPVARQAFDALLLAMLHRPGIRPAEMVELADVQAALGSAEERLAFGRLVFPDSSSDKDVALAAVGEGGRHLVATTHVVDRTGSRYTVRDPIDPAELGRLVQLLVRSGVPRAYAEGCRNLVALDARERVVAGVTYSLLEGAAAQLDGVAVTAALRGRGLATALLDDLCARLRGLGVDILTRHIAFRDVPLGRAWSYDGRWRCLVRPCGPLES